jgi:hypothetical protein
VCAAGCDARPDGEYDRCLGDACASLPGDGEACSELLRPYEAPGRRYICRDGVTQSSAGCPHGCLFTSALDDAVCAADPCNAFPFADSWGFACGQNLAAGGAPADVNRLYLCEAGRSRGNVVCASGCFAAPLNEPDRCNGSDPCRNLPFDQAMCGQALSPDALPGSLYRCVGQATASRVDCTGACTHTGIDSDDSCAPAS